MGRGPRWPSRAGGGRRSRQQLRRPVRIRTVGARAPPWPVLVQPPTASRARRSRRDRRTRGPEPGATERGPGIKTPGAFDCRGQRPAGRAGPNGQTRGVDSSYQRVLCCHIPPTCSSATSVQCEYAPGLAIRGHMRGRSCARHGQLKARPPCARRPGRDRIKSLANEPQPRLVARACVFCAKPRGDSGIDWSRASFKRPRPLHPHTTTTTTTTTGSGSDAPLLLWH